MKNAKGKDDFVTLPITTFDGEFVARYSANGLASLDFPAEGRTASSSADVPKPVRHWHQTTVTALKRALAGAAPGNLPPLDLSKGTAFQQSVWSALRKIGSGATRSYGEIAKLIGKPAAVRAVGGACGANPIPVLVPCHRVLAAGGKLGGFGGGLNWKRKLLEREGVKVDGERRS